MNKRIVPRLAAFVVCGALSAGCRPAQETGVGNPKTIKLAFVTNN